ncbi:7-methylxanthosine synthase 1-like [Cannabis sativa]|uniref:7-methylxanthosine synthase 1-like n=1 Tax=Cannabis sativa TaxID=3483 RepID=UPI0029CA371F|nr:7-methylxanthosine synthase 1-like [Cannabis sativa]
MEAQQVLPIMKSGDGNTSYAKNSSLQKMVISKVRGTVENAALEVYCNILPDCMRIADLGCSSGPNSLAITSYILEAIMSSSQFLSHHHQNPLTFQVFLNDLLENDFNTIFQSLSSFYEDLKKKEKKNEKRDEFIDPLCFVMAMPGSFYGRLFPNNFIHFFHSSYSLHWLSKVPKGLVSERGEAYNKGNIYITKRSPDVVVKAYLGQFEEDFTTFLRCRSEEIVVGGCMVLTMLGSIISNDPKHLMEVMGRAFNDMVSEGIIEEKSLDNCNIAVYCPSGKEVRKVIEEEGSFELQKMEMFELAYDAGFINNAKIRETNNDDKYNRAKYVSDYMRAVFESILQKHFGESVLDDFFMRFTHKIIESSLANENWPYINFVISLTKNN